MGNPPPTAAAAQLAHSWHRRYKVGWHHGTAGNCSVQNQPVARQRKWGIGTAALPTSTNTGPPTHQAGGAPRSAPVHRCTRLPLGAPTCKVVTRLVADQIWCTTCTEPHTRKQARSSIDSDYHPCPPAHQRFFVALGRSPKAAHRKYEYTVGSCYETVRLFTHGGHLPRLPHRLDNRQCW